MNREQCLEILCRGATDGELRKWAGQVLKRPKLIRLTNGKVSFEPMPPRGRGRPPIGKDLWLENSRLIEKMMADIRGRWKRDLFDNFSLYEDARREARKLSRRRAEDSITDILRERLKAAGVGPKTRTTLLISLKNTHDWVVKHHGKTKAEVFDSLRLGSERTARRRRQRAREKHRKLSGRNRPN